MVSNAEEALLVCGLYSITGGSFYYFGTEESPPALRVPLGFSNQADVTAALDDNGTGTTK